MKSDQVSLMLTWDWCKMLNVNVPMIGKSCVPYPRSTSLTAQGRWIRWISSLCWRLCLIFLNIFIRQDSCHDLTFKLCFNTFMKIFLLFSCYALFTDEAWCMNIHLVIFSFVVHLISQLITLRPFSGNFQTMSTFFLHLILWLKNIHFQLWSTADSTGFILFSH